jgi:hypothetical protein
VGGEAVPALVVATICSAFGRDEFRHVEVVMAVIAGCGGSDEDQRRWVSAWCRLRLEDAAATAAEVRELRPVPSAEAG